MVCEAHVPTAYISFQKTHEPLVCPLVDQIVSYPGPPGGGYYPSAVPPPPGYPSEVPPPPFEGYPPPPPGPPGYQGYFDEGYPPPPPPPPQHLSHQHYEYQEYYGCSSFLRGCARPWCEYAWIVIGNDFGKHQYVRKQNYYMEGNKGLEYAVECRSSPPSPPSLRLKGVWLLFVAAVFWTNAASAATSCSFGCVTTSNFNNMQFSFVLQDLPPPPSPISDPYA
ncbi:hypothetical protein RJ639_004478 [Escallonia herrerae]|uniref:Uncharacterized protein n=1 Tax=Escallonia herrerae TaxID=1293975 RepID=A0AA88W1Z8_9ASTE|nr:hypothetical protein RJ639_004478 [Escallonia herrerae]